MKSGVEEEEERAPLEKGKMLNGSCLLCHLSPIYGIANIPLYERDCDVDIAHVVEVRGQHRKTTIAADDELLRSGYEWSDPSL